ncbi:MAG: VOC family protein [Proteobacteria bacterium]|nr:VOC family protein [Pseudomonadota bacterium]
MEQRLSLITLGVADLDRSRTFYGDGLGWTPSKLGSDAVVFFQAAGVVFGLYGREALAADAGLPDAEGSGFRGVSLAYNTRSREEVDDVLALAESAGARITKPAEEAFWGGYSGYFADPDGHLWEVAWNPGFDIDAAGHVRLPPDPPS